MPPEKNPFGERLARLLIQHGISQNRLAQQLGISRSTVTGWIKHGTLPDAGLLRMLCEALGCSADWLIGVGQQREKQDATGVIQWVEEIPPFIPDVQREPIEHGLHLFHGLVNENRTAQEIRSRYPPQFIRSALQAAFRSGAIRLTAVTRATDLEHRLREKYSFLKDVVVAEIPGQCEDTLIRTELVTFLAATQVLTRVIRESAIGLGSGYTMLRFVEHSIPSADQFSGTAWIPLLAFAPHNMSDYSANLLARLMSIRHPGSRALYLPHPAECATPEMQTVTAETQRYQHNLQTIFASVSGVDRRDGTGESHLLTEFRSADYAAEAPFLRDAYARLPDKSRFGGELLRYLLDTEGQILSYDEAVGSQVNLDILRYNSDMIGRVCLIAARRYKAMPILTCLNHRLANAVVIDREIAESILKERVT
ncbi:MAG: helix-turn-helix domain-containing protein [Anaerolineae bacterium]|nr:helix-turn-helix domain-containing protein [Anaerolineae bacterium]